MKRILNFVFFISVLVFSHSAFSSDEVLLVKHVVSDGENLSTILYKYGIGQKNAKYDLYGSPSFVSLTKKFNKHVGNWNSLETGTELVLVVPGELAGSGGEAVSDESGNGYFLHKVAYTDSLPNIMLKRGLKRTNPTAELWGTNGYVEKAIALNPHLKGWERVKKGTVILLPLPSGVSSYTSTSASVDSEPVEEPIILTEEQEVIVEEPEKATAKEIASLPKEEIEKIPPEVLEEKLDEEAIAGLDEEEVEKIPDEVKKEKAWDFSIMDLFQPGVSNFLAGVSEATGAGYTGLRLGIPLVTKSTDPLLSQAYQIGLLVELRGGVMEGFRMYWDYVPEIKATTDNIEQKVSWSRLLLAWAFAFDAPALVDTIHVSPKLGRYSLDSTLIANDTAGNLIGREFSIGGGLSFGLELDMELTHLFYILRGWASRDMAIAGLSGSSGESVISTKFGLDLFLKGSGFEMFGSNMSLSYLLFTSSETTELTGKDESDEEFVVELVIPYLGAGLSLMW